MEKLLQRGFKIPFGARNTAKKIQAQRIVLGKGVAGDDAIPQAGKGR